MILMALETTALSNFPGRVAFTMTLTARLDPGQEKVGSVVAFDRANMAGRTGNHAVSAMIELSMSQPARRDIRVRDLRHGAACGIQNVALPASLGP